MTTETPPAPSLGEHLAKWDALIWRESLRLARWLRLDPDEVRAEGVARVVAWFPGFDPERAAFSTWAGIVVRGVAQEMVVRRERRVRASAVIVPAYNGHPPTDVLDLTPERVTREPLDELVAAEARATITAALEELPDEQREALKLRFWEPDARLTSAGRRRVREGLAMLREALAGRCEGES